LLVVVEILHIGFLRLAEAREVIEGNIVSGFALYMADFGFEGSRHDRINVEVCPEEGVNEGRFANASLPHNGNDEGLLAFFVKPFFHATSGAFDGAVDLIEYVHMLLSSRTKLPKIHWEIEGDGSYKIRDTKTSIRKRCNILLKSIPYSDPFCNRYEYRNSILNL